MCVRAQNGTATTSLRTTEFAGLVHGRQHGFDWIAVLCEREGATQQSTATHVGVMGLGSCTQPILETVHGDTTDYLRCTS